MGSAADRLPSDPVTARANGLAALTLLGALQRLGLRHLVLCPGSRSAPLAVAAALLESRGLRLHPAIDERSAAFFALGLGRALGQPAAVVTTSGTAVAQLLAASVEADLGTIPLLLLSADRPQRLKNCGANQAVPQERFLLASCRRLLEGPPQGLAAATGPQLEAMAAAAFAAACGDGRIAPAGPVHLNLPFDEPLHADGADLEALATWLNARADGPVDSTIVPVPALQAIAPTSLAIPMASQAIATASQAIATAAEADPAAMPADAWTEPLAEAPAWRLDPDRPGVVVAGPWRGSPQQWQAHVEALRRWQRRSGWPLLADVLSGLRGLSDLELVSAYDPLLLRPEDGSPAEQVLRLGPLPASRRLQRWLESCGGRQVLVSQGDPRQLDPLGTVSVGGQWSGGLARWVEAVLGPAATLPAETAASGQTRALARHWLQLEAAAQRALQRHLSGSHAPQPLPATGRGSVVALAGCSSGAAAASDSELASSVSPQGSRTDPSGEVDRRWLLAVHRDSDGRAAPVSQRAAAGEPNRQDKPAIRSDSSGADASADSCAGRPDAGRDASSSFQQGCQDIREQGRDGRHEQGCDHGLEKDRDDSCDAGPDAGPALSEPWLARELSFLLPQGLAVMLASSSPVRDWESFAAAAPWRMLHGFRGASGIDGTLSIACGLAEALGQLVLVSGDLALLHDANGWLWARQLRGRLTVVLIDNGGGGIFEQLPIRPEPPERLDFDRLFAMPQAVDQLALAALHGVPGRRVQRRQDLAADLAWALEQPFAVLELRTDRQADAALRQRLRRAVTLAAGSIGRMAPPDRQHP